ncbi:hypothetical protein [Allocoleopsis sp.]
MGDNEALAAYCMGEAEASRKSHLQQRAKSVHQPRKSGLVPKTRSAIATA